MSENTLEALIGRKISLPGHFDVPVTLEAVRALGADGSAGCECRVRLPDGFLEETTVSEEEAASLIKEDGETALREPVDADKFHGHMDASEY